MYRFLKDSLLVLRYSKLHHVPPAQYQTEILSENGFPVLVLEFGDSTRKKIKSDRYTTLQFSEWPVLLLPKRHRTIASFALIAMRLIWACFLGNRPKLIVAHGLQEAYLAWLMKRWFEIPYVVDVHECFDPDEVTGLNRWLLNREKVVLGNAEFLIFPELEREKVYRNRYEYTVPAFFVFNCPRPLQPLDQSFDLRRHLKVAPNAKLMLYIGGLGDLNAIEVGIKSLVLLPDVHFVLVGWSDPEYRKKLDEVIRSRNLLNRVHFASLSYEEKWRWLAAVDFSFCIYRPVSLRMRHVATASNKLTESLAAGIPVLTTDQPDFKAIVEKYEVGVTISEIGEFQIAEAVNRLIKNPDLAKQLGANGRREHLKQLNYDYQFRKVLGEFRTYFPVSEMTPSLARVSSRD